MSAPRIAVGVCLSAFAVAAAAIPPKQPDYESRIQALEAAVATLQARVTSLEAQVTTQQGTISALDEGLTAANSAISSLQLRTTDLETSSVMGLAPFLEVTASGTTPRARLTGINLQIVNGAGSTYSQNGKGNLIIGYDEVRSDGVYSCSLGEYADETSCRNGGGTWAVSHKSGSHYLIVGIENNYSRWGGLVVGYRNTATGGGASVSGGIYGTASGPYTSVTGGLRNTATGDFATVGAGFQNIASGRYASVCGGQANIAFGQFGSVLGGADNHADGYQSTVVGGIHNHASYTLSSILGGTGQHTSRDLETIPAIQ